MDFCRKTGQHFLFLMILKKGVFGAHTCFGHVLDFQGFQKSKKHCKTCKNVNFGNFQKMHPPFQKVGCWNGCRKGVSLSVIQKNNCALLTALFYSALSKTQHFQKEKV